MPAPKPDPQLLQRLQEVSTKLHKINDEETRRRSERRVLEDEKTRLLQTLCSLDCGRCFQVGPNKWACIIDYPQVQHTMTAALFNEYQRPSLIVDLNPNNENDSYLYFDTIFSNSFPECRMAIGKYQIHSIYEEITQEEFLQKMNEAFHMYTSRVLQAAARRAPAPNSACDLGPVSPKKQMTSFCGSKIIIGLPEEEPTFSPEAAQGAVDR